MSEQPKENFDRRDFMIASIATVGVSATLAANAGTANAQNTSSAGPASQGTIYTGDVIQGKKVISALDVGDLEPGKKHAFYFQGVQMPTGQHWYVSVLVAKGAKPGKRMTLISGVHGDEISPVHTIQSVMNGIDPAQMSGTVLAVFDVSRPAMEGMARRWPNSGRGIGLVDINRVFPGNENGPDAPTRHAALVFNRLLKPNSDYAIDFHTSTTGMDITALHVARMEIKDVRAMAELFPIQHIFDNPAYPGLLANAFIDAGIPAFTPEIGAARKLDLNMISLFVEGTMNVLKLHGIIAGPMGRTGKDAGTFTGNSMGAVLASQGGFVELLVRLNDKVAAGQKVALQRNAFGEIVAQYTAPMAGEVAALRTDATSEPGNLLVVILYGASAPAGAEIYPE
ncbi:MAG: succinylglutamate desuccinylase/aspartoacylase family protein [Sphingopyxis sp.]|nr:succinylglutamate desuccinylase/aspartoacylase family protein [Sphingopyxis sp.]